MALNYWPVRPKGVTISPGKGLSRRGGACFGRARYPNGIEICQVRVRDRCYTLHPKPCHPYSEFLSDTRAEASRTKGRAEPGRGTSTQRGGTTGRGGAGERGRVRVFVLENQTAPRGGAAPPSPCLGDGGGAARPPRGLSDPEYLGPPEPGNGDPQGLLEKGKPSPCKGGRDVSLFGGVRLGMSTLVLGKSKVGAQDTQVPQKRTRRR